MKADNLRLISEINNLKAKYASSENELKAEVMKNEQLHKDLQFLKQEITTELNEIEELKKTAKVNEAILVQSKGMLS